MKFWVLAFGGEYAEANREMTMTTGEFWVSSNRIPILHAEPGDKALLYAAGEGFVGQAVVGSSARTPYGSVGWSGKNEPQYGISVSDIRTFSSPILYKFPKKGPHPSLGFHPYALTGGFLTLSEEGFEDVLGWTRRVELPSTEVPVTETVAESSPEIIPEASSEAPQPGRFAETRRIVKPSQGKDQGKTWDPGSWQKRVAGQHALKEGRKRAVL